MGEEFDKLFGTPSITPIVSILNEMNAPELEALAVKLHEQIDRTSTDCETPRVELEDVKGWVELRKKESESCFDLSLFLNLI